MMPWIAVRQLANKWMQRRSKGGRTRGKGVVNRCGAGGFPWIQCYKITLTAVLKGKGAEGCHPAIAG